MYENSVLIGAERSVPTSLLDMDRVYSDLYIENKATTRKEELGLKLTKRDYEGVELYREDGDYVHLPRGYPVPWADRRDAPTSTVKPAHLVISAKADIPHFRMTLRDNQLPAAKALRAAQGQDKTLCLGCGKGKTILALWYAWQLGVRTIVLVDRDFLADQWIRRIKQAFWIPRHNIARIQGNKKWFEADFTIAMIKTLANRDLGQWAKQFGLIIPDECDVLAAPTFHKLIPQFPGERLGLSATLDRKDGMHPVFMYHLGGLQPCYVDLKRFQSATWIFRRMPRCLGTKALSKCKSWIPAIKKRWMNRALLDSALEDSARWNHAIVKDVNAALSEGRNCIVLGTRTVQLQILRDALEKLGWTVGYVDKDVKGKERNKAFRAPVILATNSLASRALDVEKLDTLFLLYPSNDTGFLRQALGRIDRPLSEKFKPMIIIYSHSYIEEMAKAESKMRDVIRDVDPDARVEAVRVSLERNQ